MHPIGYKFSNMISSNFYRIALYILQDIHLSYKKFNNSHKIALYLLQDMHLFTGSPTISIELHYASYRIYNYTSIYMISSNCYRLHCTSYRICIQQFLQNCIAPLMGYAFIHRISNNFYRIVLYLLQDKRLSIGSPAISIELHRTSYRICICLQDLQQFL